MRISDELRKELKRPLGKLVSFNAFLLALKSKRLKETRVVAVGDVVGKKLKDTGITPWIWIYDGQEARKRVRWEIPLPTHAAINPRGEITESLMAAIDDALRKKIESRIYVKGEEDLAGLYCIAAAPIGTVMVYGQPHKGIVVVPITKEKKQWASEKLQDSSQ
jgi:hypothetical protein